MNNYTNEAENSDNEVNICRELSKENNDFYVEDEATEEVSGYRGDSIEAAAEYKRKAEEEQKKKAEEQATQQAKKPQQNSASQSSSANWIMPVNGKITSGFGKRKPPVPGASDFHNGWDIAVNIGTPVKAIADGKVIATGPAKGYGKWVVIDHGRINGVRVTSEYGHISEYCVSYGQFVKKGQIIAKSGNAGISSGPHLHITIREGEKFQGKDVDPNKYIKANF